MGKPADETRDTADEREHEDMPADEPAQSSSRMRTKWLLGLLMLALLGSASWYLATQPGGTQGVERANAEVNAGIAATGTAEAIGHFRKALEQHPKHYGATYQLARALDRAGRLEEARQTWQQVLEMAQSYGDQKTLAQAQARLGVGTSAVVDPMAAGMDALYKQGNAAAAVVLFRQQLVQNPRHYGATFQLASALERSGDLPAALASWTTMLAMADAIHDTKTADHARTRIIALRATAQNADDPHGALMKQGLDALYSAHTPAAAEKLFRSVLEQNPNHYGANYQLAMALDQAGKAEDARAQWLRVAEMADALGDQRTAEEARTRLAKTAP